MSTVKANDLMKVDGGIPTVKSQQLIPTAWVNFNGNGSMTLRDSENVSSLTDVAGGHYRVTYITAMANSNYVVFNGSATHSLDDGDNRWKTTLTAYSTTSHDVKCTHIQNGVQNTDQADVFSVVMGGQA